MGKRKVTIAGKDGKKRARNSGVYIPRGKARKRIEDGAAVRDKAASPHARPSSRSTERRGDDRPGSLIGGVRSSGIRARTQVSSIAQDPQLTEEERRKIWQPPVRDTSRFDGSNASRHSSRSQRMAPADSPGGSFAAMDEMPPERKRKAPGAGRKPKGKGRGPSAKGVPISTSPLSQRELKALDSNYRLHGADPEWKGWDKLLPGRTREFLLSEARRRGLDRPDDSTWTKGELSVFGSRWRGIAAGDPVWRTLLPRKSPAAIAEEYRRRSSYGSLGAHDLRGPSRSM